MGKPLRKTWALWLTALAVLLFGAAELFFGRDTAEPLSVTLPDTDEAETILVVCGGTVALIDPAEEDADALRTVLRSRRIGRIDVLIRTDDEEAPSFLAEEYDVGRQIAAEEGETVCVEDAVVEIGGEEIRILHGENVIRINDETAASMDGASVYYSDGRSLRVQPEGSRFP